MHLLLVAMSARQPEHRGIAGDPVHETEEAGAGRLGSNERRHSRRDEEMHLEYLLVIDSRETNKFNQGLLGEFALFHGRGRGSECVVRDVGSVALEGGECEGIVRLLVADEA
jgi:hypothetical protein